MKKLAFALASMSLVLATASLSACSSDDDGGDDDDTTSSSSGGATSSSSSSGAATSSSSSGGTAALNGCETFVDHTGDTEVEITWTNPLSDGDACSKIKVGTKVTFNGDFVAHPLNSKGGDSPNPIVSTKTGSTASFTFGAEGDFGYTCTIHSNMKGVFQVVP